MSQPEQSARHPKRCADAAISHAFTMLASNDAARAAFSELVRTVQRRGSIPARGGHLLVEAMTNLARHRRQFIRPIEAWQGSDGGVNCQVAALANHLLCEHKVPTLKGCVWGGFGRRAV